MQITKAKMESMCRMAGMQPVARDTFEGHELFVADGFSAPPHHAFRRFGVEENEFLLGCYVTIFWFAKGEDKLDIGLPLIIDAAKSDNRLLHARINAAKKEARQLLKDRKKAAN